MYFLESGSEIATAAKLKTILSARKINPPSVGVTASKVTAENVPRPPQKPGSRK
jgi:hypothetical protein